MDVFTQLVAEQRPFLRDAAAAAAHELGVFDALDAPRDAEALSRALGVKPRRLRSLLDVLVLDGALARAGGPARPSYARARVPPRPPPLPPLGWGALARVIREDRPLADADDAEALRRYQIHLFELAGAPARALARRFAEDLREGAFLDAGGGAGGYTHALLQAFPHARATLADRADVLALARDALAVHGDRVQLVEADLRELDLPPHHRLALLANVLHLHGPQACERIVGRTAGALAPGGVLLVKDLRVEPDRSGPETSVLFALNMALYSEGGDVHNPDRLAGFLHAAGLQDVRIEPLDGFPDAVVALGRRPPKRG